ncbi:class I SAM-dependent methyltransferase [Aquiflexum gelatinilyticum]|uniref:class I SAM-dependent methyltransferase n=1 Tax=Aquiflexum gelatinilyticum TaxID=2961943 RepID=UPI00216A3AAB|nr:class I SAM-dependent methyltransferase [Aquiflexum gelatinilyticum]MCS4434561.1 class I SAM-dependent methyltransferase [Aquiflexum gelatinilyticum]
MEGFLKFRENFLNIPIGESFRKSLKEPTWINNFIPGLDLISLYGYLVKFNSKLYIEIGSGNSTKIAKRAIEDFSLGTKIISIDPVPRAEINEICNQIIRSPLENIDLSIFNELEAGDILFVDNSHRVFMNSDVTTVFLDIIPQLKKGVIIQVHDIFLPYDYPQEWSTRFYSEQYMLANLILYGQDKIEILFPCFYVSRTKELADTLSPLWQDPYFSKVEKHGGSFWFRKI